MVAKRSLKAQAWDYYDQIIAEAAPGGKYSNPWVVGVDARDRIYQPDYNTLEKLLAVPLRLEAPTQSGVPALALDVWISYEFKRAGFTPDDLWPRAELPRILPGPISGLLHSLPKDLRETLQTRLFKGNIPNTTSADANILGKNYLKQVDVVMSNWQAGPELLISTKRMDSSFAKNAPNRMEEAYGDAKNLRLRHPLAATGFLFGLRSTAFTAEPDTAAWITDLLQKLGQEEDAYHTTCLVVIHYDDKLQPEDDKGDESQDTLAEDGSIKPESELQSNTYENVADGDGKLDLKSLPPVQVLTDSQYVPEDLSLARFLTKLVTHIISATPVTHHKEARRRRREANQPVEPPSASSEA